LDRLLWRRLLKGRASTGQHQNSHKLSRLLINPENKGQQFCWPLSFKA